VSSIPRELVVDVDLLCLDAGNCVIFLDHARVAAFATAAGAPIDVPSLMRGEAEAKLQQERGAMVDVDWAERALPGALGWGRMVGTMLVVAGFPRARIASFLESLWADHVRHNLYSLVPEGLGAALDDVRARGVRVVIVSNSEGMLDRLFVDLGILRHFDAVVDSGKVGVEKPDPRIFRIALDRFGVPAERALMLGDTFATDIAGARAAGIRAALIDVHGQLEGRHLDVPRVAGVTDVARAIGDERARARSR
jgi:putative hydrolase of the HAD superfamily